MSTKRILLHINCIIHRPKNYRFYMLGILRELCNK
jgi:hypothetical protein